MAMQCPRCHREVKETWAHCPYDGEVLTPLADPISTGSLHHKMTGMAGAIIGGRFQIKGFVNKGATARVYLAEDIKRRDPVIVKLFSPGEDQSEQTHARFKREAELLMGLDHPNIIKVLSFGEMQGRPYVVTEPLRGESLHDYLKREHTMPSDMALAMMRHAGLGLVAAHQAGIVHRDVKPGNLFLLGPVGNPYGLKVIDFGMAKGEKSGRISNHDLVLGTVEYMAPEQIVTDPSDARTDVYGLGVVMFRVFTGHLPFDVETDFELLAHQMFSAAPPPSWLNEEIDPRIEKVILRAMRKRPDNRYPSMEALVADLERILGFSPHDDVSPAPSRVDDTYEPLTPAGLQAAEALLRQFGVVLEG
jgi:eukaryotic-like serine/threonine-protein kinase